MTATTALFTALSFTSSAQMVLDHGQEYAGVANGSVVAKDLRPALWRFTGSSIPLSRSQRVTIEAILAGLHGSINSFLAWSPKQQYPAGDPTGSIVGSSAVKLNSVNADLFHFSLKGLPAAYVITAGDLVAVTHGSRFGLYRAIGGVTANGSGVTAEFEVWPAIRSTAAINDAVSLKQPAAEMIVVPGTRPEWNATSAFTDAVTIQAIQV